MNLPLFLARRLRYRQHGSFSGTVAVIGIVSVALALAVMIVSFSILRGFQYAIRDKIVSFNGHVQVSKFTQNQSLQETPITSQTPLYLNYRQLLPQVRHVQRYGHKAGLLKTDDEILGAVLKGVGPEFDTAAFRPNLLQGRFPRLGDTAYSAEVLLSRRMVTQLRLAVDSTVLMYFVQNPPRARKLTVCGIYETGLDEFDNSLVLGDLRLVQRLNDWPDSLVGGYEIFLNDFEELDPATDRITEVMEVDMGALPVTERFQQLFDWLLPLLGRNVTILLTLILVVACFNLTAVLFILIMERTHMVGTLKALGATNGQIRQLFLYGGLRLVGWGLLAGNAVGLGFCALQSRFKLIPLNPENYYMNTVPIDWNPLAIGVMNLGLLALVLAVLLLPTAIVARIRPVQAIRFD